MSAKKIKNLVNLDSRGRVTIPAEMRGESKTFALEMVKDGTIRLVPQEVVNISDSVLLRSLKKSAQQAKRGEVEDIPEDWFES